MLGQLDFLLKLNLGQQSSALNEPESHLVFDSYGLGSVTITL
jgi:hypothetical protein